MRLRHISEAMGHVEYKPPANPRQLVADFYVIQLLDSRPAGTPSHRNDHLAYDIQHVKQVLVPHVREVLLSEAGYSIACELRHSFNKLEEIDSNYVYKPLRPDFAIEMLIELDLPLPMVGLLYTCSVNDKRPDPDDVDMPMKLACAKVGVTMFADDQDYCWFPDYGGEPWVMICKTWLQLYAAKSMSDAIVYSDKMFSIQHNNGSVLNKSGNFDYDGYGWIEKMLDLKFEANEPEQLIPYASTYVRKLATAALRINYNRSWGGHPKLHPRKERQDLHQAFVDGLSALGFEYSDDTDYNYINHRYGYTLYIYDTDDTDTYTNDLEDDFDVKTVDIVVYKSTDPAALKKCYNWNAEGIAQIMKDLKAMLRSEK